MKKVAGQLKQRITFPEHSSLSLSQFVRRSDYASNAQSTLSSDAPRVCVAPARFARLLCIYEVSQGGGSRAHLMVRQQLEAPAGSPRSPRLACVQVQECLQVSGRGGGGLRAIFKFKVSCCGCDTWNSSQLCD